MALTLQVTQQFPIEIQPVDARGNPAAVDGAPAWSVSDETLLTVDPADDGLSAVVSAVGPVGSAQVTVRADARMGAEVREIVGTLDVSLVAAEAATLRLVPGVPTEIEATPTPEPVPEPTPDPANTPIPDPNAPRPTRPHRLFCNRADRTALEMAIKPHTDAARLLSRTGGGHYGAGGPAHRARVKDNKKRVRLESSFLVIVVYPPRPGNAGTDLLRQRFSLTVTAGLAGRSFHRRARLFYSRKKARLALERSPDA
ncbi:MAG: hypothetical protein IPI57_13705 [Candidatus Competibacteraceae bacterium]|nr:hypothetical protein [Candidatus Competibacteraceae bacterium]